VTPLHPPVEWYQSTKQPHGTEYVLCSVTASHPGVLQGAVTSPKLFNFHLYHFPQRPADDVSAYAMRLEIQILCDRINMYMSLYANVLRECNHYNVLIKRYFNISSLHELFDTVNGQYILGFILEISGFIVGCNLTFIPLIDFVSIDIALKSRPIVNS